MTGAMQKTSTFMLSEEIEILMAASCTRKQASG